MEISDFFYPESMGIFSIDEGFGPMSLTPNFYPSDVYFCMALGICMGIGTGSGSSGSSSTGSESMMILAV